MAYSSADFIANDEDLLDFNMIQSGHGNVEGYDRLNFRKVSKDYDRKPIKPTFDTEPRYEDIPVNFKPENGYYDDFDVRQAARGKAYAFIYIPYGLEVEVKMGIISGDRVKASWYNPRNGKYNYLGEFVNDGVTKFNPLSHGRNNDWVLVLDGVDLIN
ncbi:MAG: putative collagen-binding domain-containing protein [bacterium]